ncbi:YdcF family protein [Rhodovulum sulfidophilum]|uniref:YdcF family protein n=1 Tax=Rhodovulum sulfidophilum TaxID=35806 RepID=UPI0019223AA8|nr:YdcF family protein [Rhodovulum sulfidophilum]MBL3566046.1 YdcF family protein [Rhodovulum sulfidophilum]MBL3587513.1 YdcF family protein [Rhodovulum sulfidophilum]
MDTALFILSKLIGLALQVETWLVIGMVVSIAAERFARPRLGRWSFRATLAALFAVGIFPIGEILLRPLEAEFAPMPAPSHIDGIVVLGGVEDPRATAAWRDPQLNEAAERLTAAAALAIAHPEVRLVFSGGSGRLRNAMLGQPEIPSVAVDFFVSLGIDPARITWEDQSRNTAENARFSYEVAAPAPGETWVLVTSAFHMGRALACFEAAGWGDIVPHPVDYRTGSFSGGIGWNLAGNLEVLNIAIKDWVGRLAYRFTGR